MIPNEKTPMRSIDCRALAVSGMMLLLQACLQAPIEGQWEVRCHPPSDDCPNFTVSLDSDGDIVDLDLWGLTS